MKVYTFLCRDGFWRTRCENHISAPPFGESPQWWPQPGVMVPVVKVTKVHHRTHKATHEDQPMWQVWEGGERACPVCYPVARMLIREEPCLPKVSL